MECLGILGLFDLTASSFTKSTISRSQSALVRKPSAFTAIIFFPTIHGQVDRKFQNLCPHPHENRFSHAPPNQHPNPNVQRLLISLGTCLCRFHMDIKENQRRRNITPHFRFRSGSPTSSISYSCILPCIKPVSIKYCGPDGYRDGNGE